MASKPTRLARVPLSLALKWSIAVSVAASVLLIAVLSLRMAAGEDPVLGPKLAADHPNTTAGAAVAAPPLTQQLTPAPAPAPPPAPVQTTTS